MKMKKLISVLVIIFVFFTDLITKLLVTSHLKLYGSKTIIKNFFNITYTKNRGAAFGILENKSVFILAVSVIILFYLLYEVFKRNNTKYITLGLSMIIGGLLSNLSDRVFLGYVRDFLDFKILGHNFAIFNLGDVAIVVGCAIFLFATLWEEKHAISSKR